MPVVTGQTGSPSSSYTKEGDCRENRRSEESHFHIKCTFKFSPEITVVQLLPLDTSSLPFISGMNLLPGQNTSPLLWKQ